MILINYKIKNLLELSNFIHILLNRLMAVPFRGKKRLFSALNKKQCRGHELLRSFPEVIFHGNSEIKFLNFLFFPTIYLSFANKPNFCK